MAWAVLYAGGTNAYVTLRTYAYCSSRLGVHSTESGPCKKLSCIHALACECSGDRVNEVG